MVKFTRSDIEKMHRPSRLHLINAIGGAKPVNLVGTIDAKGNENLAVFSSVVHFSSHPPILGIVLRPGAEQNRHTWHNIQATGSFTINLVDSSLYRQAHATSARYPAAVSEFSVVGLTPHYVADIAAPMVLESKMRLALALRETLHVQSNHAEVVIGEVLFLEIDEALLEADGHVDMNRADAVVVVGLDTYFSISELSRLPRAEVTTNGISSHATSE
jgi:flavin reductase (DIM6/NTAB) family NADH-FMN oxidoreductase RutF